MLKLTLTFSPVSVILLIMSKKKNFQSQTDFVDEFSEVLVVETFKLMAAKGKTVGNDIALAFLSKFVGVYIHQALSDPGVDLITSQEKYEHAAECFKQAKEDVTHMVAVGVGGAMKAFSGKDVEYYCTLRVMPEPVNKLPS